MNSLFDISHESDESFPAEVPLSPSMQKSYSVGNVLFLEGSSSVAEPDEVDEQQLTEYELLGPGVELSRSVWKNIDDEDKSSSFVLTKARSFPNLASSGTLSRIARSRSLDNLFSLAERTDIGIVVNPFTAESPSQFRDSLLDRSDASTAVIDDDEHFQSMSRIEKWVSQIEIHDGDFTNEFEEEGSSVHEESKDRPRSNPRPSTGFATVASQHYLSALSPSSTSAHLTNLGLAVIPFLGSFTSLRILDLSGNSILRMTTGTFPRGLHVLSVARNNIAAIEGIRELTRLRVLDLSYNRIFRIGHGLGGCTALKELYLGGNRIGEVEGLHRLLKLSVLDLQKNRIATAKSLGQLAANYASLQALNLDGNPVLRNIGEEQLRRHLSGLIPRLVYFNKHALKPVSAKDIASHAAATAARSDRRHHRHVSRRSVNERSSTRRSSRLSPLPRTTGVKLLPPVGAKNDGANGIGGRLLPNSMRKVQSAGTLHDGQHS